MGDLGGQVQGSQLEGGCCRGRLLAGIFFVVLVVL